MATVQYDSELMSLQVPAVVVPGSRSFATIKDERAQPCLISHSTNNKLLVIKEDATGNRHAIDLTRAFGVGESTLVDFDVAQSIDNAKLYMSFATTSKDGEYMDLHVIKPFDPSEIKPGEDNSLSHLRIPHSGPVIPKTLSRVFMGPMASTISFPDVVLAFREDIRDSQDIARVAIADDHSSWTLETDFELPENAAAIYDICPVVLPIGNGYFILYEIQGRTHLLFKTINKFNGIQFQVLLKCPEGASCLGTYPDTTGFSSLVVGGTLGLQHFTPFEGQRRNHPGKKISAAGQFQNIRQLHIAHSPAAISVFATNSSNAVSYATTSDRTFSNLLDAVLLLSEQTGGAFSPFVQQEGLTQQLIVANQTGNLTMLQQDSVSGIWNRKPYYIPDLNENIDFDGYMTDMTFADAKGKPLVRQVVTLKASGHSEIIANGRHVIVGPQGTQVLTDNMGKLALLTPTDDIATDIYTLTNPGGDHPNIFGPGVEVEIDPADKVHVKLETIQSGDDLRNAKLENGEGLLDGTNASGEDIDEVAKVIKELNKEKNNIIKNASKGGAAARSLTATKSAPHILGGSKSIMARRSNALTLGWEYMKGMLEGAWDALTDWAVDFADGVANLFFEFGDKLVHFVMDTVEKIRKGLAAFWKMVIGGIERFIEWLKAIFNWGNVLKTQRALMGLVNGLLDAGPQVIEQWKPQVETQFGLVSDVIKNFVYPPAALNVQANYNSKNEHKPEGTSTEEAGAQKNYANYQLQHGGAAANAVSGQGPSNSFEAVFTEIIQPVLASFGDLFETLGENIVLLFNDKDNLSPGEVMIKLGADIGLGLLDALKQLVLGVMEVGAQIIRDIKKIANTEIHLPFFSALFEFISGGEKLSILSAASLILAIPLNVMVVTLTGGPLNLDGFNFLDFIKPQQSAAPVKTPPGKRVVPIKGVIKKGLVRPGMKADMAAAQTQDGGNDDANVGLETVMGVIEFIVRWPLLFFDLMDIDIDDNSDDWSDADFRRMTVQGKPAYKPLSLNQTDSQLYKFRARPLKLYDAKAIGTTLKPGMMTGRGIEDIKKLLTPDNFKILMQALSFIATCPFYSGGAKDPFPGFRGISWCMPILSAFLDFLIKKAGGDKVIGGIKDAILGIVNFIFVMIPAAADLDNPDVASSMAAVRVSAAVLDLISTLASAGNKIAPNSAFIIAQIGCESVSNIMLIVTVKVCHDIKQHNWMVVSSK